MRRRRPWRAIRRLPAMADIQNPSRNTDTYEPDDVQSRRVLIGAGIVAGTVLVAAITVVLLNRELAGWFGVVKFPQALRPPAAEGPALQSAPATDLEKFRAEKRL